MTRRGAGWVAALVAGAAIVSAQEPARQATGYAAAIDQLGSLDAHEIRMEAARTIRRAPPELMVPLLTRAAREHHDEYVRYRALVLLTGFGHPSTAGLMRALIGDHNDRIRTVVFGWFGHHPDPGVLAALLGALTDERSEFVRPALSRAVAAQGDDPRAQQALVPLVARGEDFFRGAVIEALGDYRAAYALPAIEPVARLDGPLQDDAITAIGKIGDRGRVPLLAGLQGKIADHLQPTLSASLCLLGVSCDSHKAFILASLNYASAAEDEQPRLRGAVHALGMLALRGHDDALAALLAAGPAGGPAAQPPIALGAGLVALREPEVVLRVLATGPAGDAALLLLRDAFDMLDEDLEEERFFAAARRAYWAAPSDSAGRRVAEALIRVLEF